MATSFMNIDLPTVSQTIGPTWATNINTAIETIDSHDHTSGKGTQIPSSGININADLSFGGFSATALLKSTYSSQSAALTGASNASSIHVVSGDLYYTNSSGSAVQITSGGTVVATAGAVQTVELQPISANTTISSGDTFVFLSVDTSSSAISITLPLSASVSSGRIYIIKDRNGNALTNNITLNAAGSDTIDGASSQILSSNYGSWWVVGDGSTSWHIA